MMRERWALVNRACRSERFDRLAALKFDVSRPCSSQLEPRGKPPGAVSSGRRGWVAFTPPALDTVRGGSMITSAVSFLFGALGPAALVGWLLVLSALNESCWERGRDERPQVR